MNKSIIIALLCGGITAALQSTGSAQQQPQQQQQPGQRQLPGGGTPGALIERGQQSMQGSTVLKSSQIVGSSVKSRDGKQVAQIRDLAIDPQTGRIEFALLSVSESARTTSLGAESRTTTSPDQQPGAISPEQRRSTTGAGAMGKLVPVPWQLLRSAGATPQAGLPSTTTTTPRPMGAHSFVLQTETDKLNNAPTIDSTDLNQLQQETFGQRVYAHFGLNWNTRNVGTPGSGIRSGTGIGTDRPDTDLNRPGDPNRPNPSRPDNRPPRGAEPPK